MDTDQKRQINPAKGIHSQYGGMDVDKANDNVLPKDEDSDYDKTEQRRTVPIGTKSRVKSLLIE